MYDKAIGATILRRYVHFTLAYWHSFKHVVHKTWKHFALELWAPMWHNLYPNSLFLIKGKHPGDELLHMLYAAFAYTSIKDDIIRIANREDGPIVESNVQMAKDLIFLFEFAIPTVTSLCKKFFIVPVFFLACMCSKY